MSDLPELKYLDDAATMAGCGSWQVVLSQASVGSSIYTSVICHAKTLQKLAELEAENALLLRENDRLDKCWHVKHTEQVKDRKGAKLWFDRYQRLRQSSPPKGDVA